jgi:hypothetical protein
MAARSDISNTPRAPRLELTRKGEIFDGASWVKILIQDISDGGLSLVCTKQFDPGQIVGLRLLLNATEFIDCTVEVRHSNNIATGVKILSMDEKYRRAYEQYLQALYSERRGDRW